MAAAPASAGSGADRGRRAAATVAAWGGWGGRPQPANILLQLRQGQLTGRGLVRAVQVRSRPGGAGRGGPGGSWRGAGEEAFPGRRSVGPTPLGWSLGVPVGCTDAVSRGGAVGSGRLEAPLLGAERGQGWAASGIDGVYEPRAQLLDSAIPAPRLHVWGDPGLICFSSLRAWSFFLLKWVVGQHCSPKRFLSLSYVILPEKPFLDTSSPSRSPLLFGHSPELVSFTLLA